MSERGSGFGHSPTLCPTFTPHTILRFCSRKLTKSSTLKDVSMHTVRLTSECAVDRQREVRSNSQLQKKRKQTVDGSKK